MITNLISIKNCQQETLRFSRLRALTRRSQNPRKSSSSGFTLIESLVAIVVVSTLLTGIAPLVAVSVASRVQARRIDQATQAARAYIDGVRGGTVPIPQRYVKALPASRIVDSDFTPPANIYPVSDPLRDAGVLVDTNNNGFSVDDPQDLVIQPMRNNGVDAVPFTRLNKEGYELVVRVYRSDAFESGAPTQVTQTGSIFTSTNGARNYPLVVMRAQIFPTQSTLDDLGNQITAP